MERDVRLLRRRRPVTEVTSQQFGEFLAPELLRMYSSLIHPEWKTIEVIANTEELIHATVRMRNPGARPPMLQCLRTGDDELFDDPWQSLGKDDIGRFGLLVLIVMQQLNDEREAMEGVALQAGFGAGAFAELDALVKRPQVAAYFGRKTLSLLEKRFEIRFER